MRRHTLGSEIAMTKRQALMKDLIESNKKIAVPKGFVLVSFFRYLLAFFVLICFSYNVLIIVTFFIMIRIVVVDYILFYKVWRTFGYSRMIFFATTFLVCISAVVLAPTIQDKAIALLEHIFSIYRRVII